MRAALVGFASVLGVVSSARAQSPSITLPAGSALRAQLVRGISTRSAKVGDSVYLRTTVDCAAMAMHRPVLPSRALPRPLPASWPSATDHGEHTCYDPGTPGTPDIIIPGTPGTPAMGDVPGTPPTPLTTIPGIPATPGYWYDCR